MVSKIDSFEFVLCVRWQIDRFAKCAFSNVFSFNLSRAMVKVKPAHASKLTDGDEMKTTNYVFVSVPDWFVELIFG